MVGTLAFVAGQGRNFSVTAVKITFVHTEASVGQSPPRGVVGVTELASAVRAVNQSCQQGPGSRLVLLRRAAGAAFDEFQALVKGDFVNDNQMRKCL